MGECSGHGAAVQAAVLLFECRCGFGGGREDEGSVAIAWWAVCVGGWK
jgi:hypothetical protein